MRKHRDEMWWSWALGRLEDAEHLTETDPAGVAVQVRGEDARSPITGLVSQKDVTWNPMCLSRHSQGPDYEKSVNGCQAVT